MVKTRQKRNTENNGLTPGWSKYKECKTNIIVKYDMHKLQYYVFF